MDSELRTTGCCLQFYVGVHVNAAIVFPRHITVSCNGAKFHHFLRQCVHVYLTRTLAPTLSVTEKSTCVSISQIVASMWSRRLAMQCTRPWWRLMITFNFVFRPIPISSSVPIFVILSPCLAVRCQALQAYPMNISHYLSDLIYQCIMDSSDVEEVGTSQVNWGSFPLELPA